ncbi:MAG TPA: OmpA family protein [Gemmatimonadaceae bacterium]|jgi:peptidoglycan-associated lipoprotein|nr:OmpA family protein [Gemmatimonadaceae bacterium]
MKANLRAVGAVILGSAVLGACATKGFVKTSVQDERAARIATDSSLSNQIAATNNEVSGLKTEVSGVKNDVSSLRNDLNSLRTEFGAKITAMEEGLKFAFPVNFAFDDATVREADKAALDRFATVVGKYYSGSMITIEGFADPAGSTRYNMDLSKRRADAVAAYLSEKGLSTSNVRTVGYGKTRLVNPKAQKEDPGAEANRRVTFVVETNGSAAAATTAALPR